MLNNTITTTPTTSTNNNAITTSCNSSLTSLAVKSLMGYVNNSNTIGSSSNIASTCGITENNFDSSSCSSNRNITSVCNTKSALAAVANNISYNKDSCNRNRQLSTAVIEKFSNSNCNIGNASKSPVESKTLINNYNSCGNSGKFNSSNIAFSTLTSNSLTTSASNIIQQGLHKQSLCLQSPFAHSPLNAAAYGRGSSSLSLSKSSTSLKAYASINSAYWLPSPHASPYGIPERKLFIGMLNKKLNENDVRKLFEVHGAIEECTVLRDQNGQSKGCAFVTFSTKHAAISAIKVTLNQNKIMEGCTSPLVVKFADTQKEKEQKKIQQMQANLWNLATNVNIPLGQTATTVSTPMLTNSPQQASPVLGADAITPASLQLLQQLQAVGLQQQLLQGLGAQASTADTAAVTAAAAAAGLLPPMTVQNLAALAAMTQSSLTNAATNPGSAQLTNTAALLCLLGKTASTGSDPNSLASAYMSSATSLQPFGSAALSTSPLASVALSTAAAAAAGKQIEGPEGCNLFIYHLPQEFTDTDLASTFLPFGNVISAKVFIDKQTNLSKCFGFVSFDNSESAQVAIKAMNGFQVGTKRLKVQLKKPKDASKPY